MNFIFNEMKVVIVTLVCLLIVCCVSLQKAESYESSNEDSNTQYNENKKNEKYQNELLDSDSVIAVLQIESIKQSGYRVKELISFIESSIANNTSYHLVEYKKVQQVIDAQKYNISGVVTDDEATKIGELLALEYIITGNLGFNMGKYSLTIKLLDVNTGEILGIENINAIRFEDIVRKIDLFIGKLFGLEITSEIAFDEYTKHDEYSSNNQQMSIEIEKGPAELHICASGILYIDNEFIGYVPKSSVVKINNIPYGTHSFEMIYDFGYPEIKYAVIDSYGYEYIYFDYEFVNLRMKSAMYEEDPYACGASKIIYNNNNDRKYGTVSIDKDELLCGEFIGNSLNGFGFYFKENGNSYVGYFENGRVTQPGDWIDLSNK